MAIDDSMLFVFSHPVSSYAQKVRIALREKGIPFNFETPENLGAGKVNADLLDANPRMEVPALIDGDFKIFDSTIILQYIEDKYPEYPLLPADPKAKAKARMIEEICDTQYEAINWGYSEIVWQHRATGELANKLVGEINKQTHQVLSWLERQLDGQPFFNGEVFGYADVCVAPVLNRTVFYGFGPLPGSPLQKWHHRIQELPSVRETFAEFAEGAKKMAGLGNYLQKDGRSREYRDHRLEWMVKSGGIEVVLAGLQNGDIRFCRAPNE